MLTMVSVDFLASLFGAASPVAHVVIGGDTFPDRLVRRFAEHCSASIWNAYGVTEVSCWASCTRFDPFS